MKLTKRYVERESAKMFIDGINLATAKDNGKKHLVEVKEKPHRLFFVLKKVWYDQIASGEKTVEYRAMTPYWAKRLQRAIFAYNNGIDLKDWTVTFRLGYSRKYPDIVRHITKIDAGKCPYEGWPGNYYRIHFEEMKQGE